MAGLFSLLLFGKWLLQLYTGFEDVKSTETYKMLECSGKMKMASYIAFIAFTPSNPIYHQLSYREWIFVFNNETIILK